MKKGSVDYLQEVYSDLLAVREAIASHELKSFEEWSGIATYNPKSDRERYIEYRNKIVLPFLFQRRKNERILRQSQVCQEDC